MIRTLATVTAAAVLLAFSNLYAQEETPAPAAPPPASESASTPAMEMEKEPRGEKHDDGDDHKGKGKGKHKGKGRGKGGDKLRGMDRADQVAGEHGKQGRDNARSRGKRGKN